MYSDSPSIVTIANIIESIQSELMMPDFAIFTNIRQMPVGENSVQVFTDNVVYETEDKLLTALASLATDTERKHLKTKLDKFYFNGKMYSVAFNVGYDAIQANNGTVTKILNGLNRGYDRKVFFGTSEPVNSGYFNNPNNIDLGNLNITNISDLTRAVGSLRRKIATDSAVAVDKVRIIISGDLLQFYLDGVDNNSSAGSKTNGAILEERFGDIFDYLSLSTTKVDTLSGYVPQECLRYRQTDPNLISFGNNDEREYTWHIFKHGESSINILQKGSAQTYTSITFDPLLIPATAKGNEEK